MSDIPPSPPEQKPLTEVPSPSQKDSQSKYIIPSIFALILSVVAIALSLISRYPLTAAELELSPSRLKADLQQLKIQIQSDEMTNQGKIRDLRKEVNQLESQQAFAETIYLIRLAHIHLTIENNQSLTIQLLKMAQQSLSNLASAEATTLTQAITDDINALSSKPAINIADISRQIEQLKSPMSTLAIQPGIPTQREFTPLPHPPAKNIWEKILYNLSGLKNLFIIRRIDYMDYVPLVKPRQALFLKENLQLKLIQAQWALLARDTSLYQESLHTAIQWLSDYGFNQAESVEIIKRLQALATIDIKPTILPLRSWKTLNELFPEKMENTAP